MVSYLKIYIQNLLKLIQILLLLQKKKELKKKGGLDTGKNIHPRESNINYKEHVFL